MVSIATKHILESSDTRVMSIKYSFGNTSFGTKNIKEKVLSRFRRRISSTKRLAQNVSNGSNENIKYRRSFVQQGIPRSILLKQSAVLHLICFPEVINTTANTARFSNY